MNASKLSVLMGVLGLVLVALPSGPAASATVALVLEAEGPIEPAQEPFTEIQAGLALTLGGDSTLLFSHYPTCREVLVRGGQLIFTEQTFLVRQGELLRDTRVGCPREIALSWDGQVAGLTMRSLQSNVVAPTPTFVLLGKAPAHFDRWRILRDGQLLAEGRVDAPKLAWPADQGPLASGNDYVLELIDAQGGDTRPIRFAVSEGGRHSITIIRLD